MSEDWAGAEPVDAEFDLQLPVADDLAPTLVAHMTGDKFVFLEHLNETMQANGSEAELLGSAVPASIAGPELDAVWAVLDSLGGASVRSIVPI